MPQYTTAMRFLTRKLERHDYIGMLYFAPAGLVTAVMRGVFHNHRIELNATDMLSKVTVELAAIAVFMILMIITSTVFHMLRLNPFPPQRACLPSPPATSTHAASTDTPGPAATLSAHPQPRPSPDA